MPKDTFLSLPSEKRERIEAVLLDEFSNNLFEACKVSSIVEKANIPRGSFYTYFDDLYDACEYIIMKFEKKMFEYVEPRIVITDNFLDTMKQHTRILIQFAVENPALFKFSENLRKSKDPVLLKKKEIKDKEGAMQFEKFINIAKEKGSIRKDIDTDVLRRLFDKAPEVLKPFCQDLSQDADVALAKADAFFEIIYYGIK